MWHSGNYNENVVSMEIFKSYHLFGLHFYISSRKMSRKTNCTEIINKNRRKLRIIKRKLYKESGGCCQECGAEFEMSGLEIHHIIPVIERPDLMGDLGNMELLCHDCHVQVHQEWYAVNDF